MKTTVTEAMAAELYDRYFDDTLATWKYAERTFTKKAMQRFLARRAARAGLHRETVEGFLDPSRDKADILESFMTEIVDPWPKRRR